MKVTCPSCSATYNSEDYPDVFEINCVCGYSILVPSGDKTVENLNLAEKNITFDSAVPSALDAEDEAILIRPEGLAALNPLDEERKVTQTSGGLGMTAPDQLPSGLLYDPFELPEPATLKSEKTPSAEGQQRDLPSESSGPVPPALSKSSELITKSQLAAMGSFLGASFDIRLVDVPMEEVERIIVKAKKILSERPWLESEIKKRSIDIEELRQTMELKNLPEIFALEIYLAAFESGGQCEFGQSS